MKTRQARTTSDQLVMLDHVKELRWRLLICVIVLVIGGVVGYFFYEQILWWLKSPLVGDLYYSSPAGSFSFVMKIAALVGIAVAIPVIIYQMIMFVRPAISRAFSGLRVFAFILLSIGLAIAGAAFAFYLILPGALNFFAGFQVEGLSALIGADSYLGFVTNVIITFMIVFQIPLLLVIIDHIKPIQPRTLFKAEKYVVLGGLVVSFFVPFALDLTTSLLIALPIILLYNLSIGIIVLRHHLVKKYPVEMTQEELALDDQLIAEFFAEPSEKVEVLAPAPLPAPLQIVSFKNVAMEFQKSRQASIDDLRQMIERDRAQAIADKVARYNTITLRPINDIR